jgi:hypothetical protein
MEIRNKRTFYEQWRSGVLGNRPQTFATPMDAINSTAKMIGFREVGKAGGGKWEAVPRTRVWEAVARWNAEGRTYTLDGAAPNELTTLHGEVCRTERGIEGWMAVEPKCAWRMAQSARIFRERTPLETRLLIRRYMDPSSQDDLEQLMELYPDAAIEFSCYPCSVGVLPRRNTLIWEIRNY